MTNGFSHDVPQRRALTDPGSSRVIAVLLTRIFGEAAGWLGPILAPYRRRLLLLLALGLAAAGAALVPPYLTKLVIDEGLLAGDADALAFWCAAFFALNPDASPALVAPGRRPSTVWINSSIPGLLSESILCLS